MKRTEQYDAQRAAVFFMLLCSAVYFTSYMTRINYGAVIVDIVSDTGISQKAAGLVSTAAFFTYGVGQLISGVAGDYIKPRLLLIIGMLVTAACNFLMPAVGDATTMMILWGINGFAQALFWPPLVRLMADNLSEYNYDRACIWVTAAASIATIVIYLLASVCTAIWDWRSVFVISGAFAVVMVVLWCFFAPKNDIVKEEEQEPVQDSSAAESASDVKASAGAAIVIMMIPIAFAIILQGIIRDGVTTWLPSLVSDVFGLPSSISILTGIALPIFAIISCSLSSKLENKMKNELVTSTVFFLCAAVSAGLLALLLDVNPIISVFLVAVVIGCMHGTNLMLISRVPRYFGKYGKISTVSGVVNAFTYVGSALSTYLFAVLSEEFGWNFTVVSWVFIAAMAAVVCIFTVRAWRKFRYGK